jgi:hypothetical protein
MREHKRREEERRGEEGKGREGVRQNKGTGKEAKKETK